MLDKAKILPDAVIVLASSKKEAKQTIKEDYNNNYIFHSVYARPSKGNTFYKFTFNINKTMKQLLTIYIPVIVSLLVIILFA